jgi:radical SAM protein with 4Fe4S-binding SPASM domain
MDGNDIIIHTYPDQHYSTLFNKKTGFFVRIEERGFEEPFWASTGPELLDISITNYCERGCSFCYRHSNTGGVHMPIIDYEKIIEQAKQVNVLQIALGGGNPNQHPNFIDVLKLTHDSGIVPSYTTNGFGITDSILKATADYCGAMAISAYPPFDNNWQQIIKKICKHGIKLNIHFLLTTETITEAIRWLSMPMPFLKNINAIIFLNYKPIRSTSELLLKKSNLLARFFGAVNTNHNNLKIGFDSCSISGIVKNINTMPFLYESCEAARFSAFISEDMKMYPCSFMANTSSFGDLRYSSIHEIWQNNPYFIRHREKVRNCNCHCSYKSTCNGGCVFLPDINLCD